MTKLSFLRPGKCFAVVACTLSANRDDYENCFRI